MFKNAGSLRRANRRRKCHLLRGRLEESFNLVLIPMEGENRKCLVWSLVDKFDPRVVCQYSTCHTNASFMERSLMDARCQSPLSAHPTLVKGDKIEETYKRAYPQNWWLQKLLVSYTMLIIMMIQMNIISV